MGRFPGLAATLAGVLLTASTAASQELPSPSPAPASRLGEGIEPGQALALSELRELTASLKSTPRPTEGVRQNEWESPLRAVWMRLAIFEMRFGLRPRASAGWKDLADTARQHLALQEERPHDPRQRFDRSMLLDWSGDVDAASRLLEDIEHDDWAFDGCQGCRLENSVVQDWHRAELALRRGDLTAARRLAERACLDLDQCVIYFHQHSMLLAWYGDLLSRVGQLSAARAVWQAIANSDPDSPGADAARRQLVATTPSAELVAAEPASAITAPRISFQRFSLACDERTDTPAGAIKLMVLESDGRRRVLLASTRVDERWDTAEESLGVGDAAFAETVRRWLDRSPAEPVDFQRRILWELLEPFSEG